MSDIRLDKFADNLSLGKDGVWRTVKEESVSYPETGHDNCFSVEDGSFWFEHRNQCIKALISRFSIADAGSPIFDIGGGNGFVSMELQRSGFSPVLVEPGSSGIVNARKRGIRNVVQATVDAAKFRPRSLSGIGVFDVVEHVEDDRAFLKSLNNLMVTGAMLYATVPAYQWLWSHKDIHAGHYRRYTLEQFSRVLQEAGFLVDYATYIFRPLPLPIFLAKALPYRLGLSGKKRRSLKDVARDHAAMHSLRARFVSKLLNGEVENVRNGKRMHIGGSILVAARVMQYTGE